MAVTSDPLSLIPSVGLEESAWLSVHLMASDIATTGFPPMYALFNLNLPPNLNSEDFKTYWDHISRFCEDLGVAIVGGHTGRFEGQNSTVAGGGTMITFGSENDIITSKGGRPGDHIIVTRECAIISTAILAISFPETIKNECGQEIYNNAQELFYKSSTVSSALSAVKAGRNSMGVTAMHDVTEGGVGGAIYELSKASGCGAEIFADKIPLGEVQEKICSHFNIDPFYSVGAGSLVIASVPEKSQKIVDILKEEGVPAVIVGNLVDKDKGIRINKENEFQNLEHPGEDPYWEAFFKAYQKGWK